MVKLIGGAHIVSRIRAQAEGLACDRLYRVSWDLACQQTGLACHNPDHSQVDLGMPDHTLTLKHSRSCRLQEVSAVISRCRRKRAASVA